MPTLDARPSLLVGIGIVLVTAGCAGDTGGDGRAGDAELRDSAGVRIVRTAWSAADTAPSFHFDDSASLTIGASAGEAPYLFSGGVRPRRLSDGRFVVLDVGTMELRFFDSAGRFVRAVGRRGEGPGEFRSATLLTRIEGDSVAMVDLTQRRMTVLAPDASVARTVRLPVGGPSAQSTFRSPGRFADGTLFFGQTPPLRRVDTEPAAESLAYIVVPPDGERADTIARLFMSVVSYSGARQITATMRSGGGRSGVIFGGGSSAVVDTDVFHYTDGVTWTVATYGRDGGLRRIARLDRAPTPVTSEDREQYLAELAASRERRLAAATSPETRAILQSRAPDPNFAATFETFQLMTLGTDRRIWLNEVVRADTVATRWWSVDSTGRFLGFVRIPRTCIVQEFGPDSVLCSATNEDGAPQVTRHAITPAR